MDDYDLGYLDGLLGAPHAGETDGYSLGYFAGIEVDDR